MNNTHYIRYYGAQGLVEENKELSYSKETTLRLKQKLSRHAEKLCETLPKFCQEFTKRITANADGRICRVDIGTIHEKFNSVELLYTSLVSNFPQQHAQQQPQRHRKQQQQQQQPQNDALHIDYIKNHSIDIEKPLFLLNKSADVYRQFHLNLLPGEKLKRVNLLMSVRYPKKEASLVMWLNKEYVVENNMDVMLNFSLQTRSLVHVCEIPHIDGSFTIFADMFPIICLLFDEFYLSFDIESDFELPTKTRILSSRASNEILGNTMTEGAAIYSLIAEENE